MLSVSKIMANIVVFLNIKDLCLGSRQIWLMLMLFYDLFHTRVIIMTIQNIFDMNNVIAKHETTLNFNIHKRYGNNQISKVKVDFLENPHSEHDEVIREYDVEQAHKNLRVSSLSPSAFRRRKMITNLIKIGNGYKKFYILYDFFFSIQIKGFY